MKGTAVQHITNATPRRRRSGLHQILIFSITTPGWKRTMDFNEVSLELYPGKLACWGYGCKVYEHCEDGTQVVWHNRTYGCPLG